MAANARNPLAMMTDRPRSDYDLLRFDRYADPIVEIVTDSETETPFTIGIFGKWGTGKTTLLEMIVARTLDKGYPAVWFNPWLYQTEDNLLVPLLQTIHDSLMQSSTERFKAAAGKFAAVAAQISASLVLKGLTAGQLSLEDIEKRLRVYTEEHTTAVSTIGTLRKQLQNILDDMTRQGRDGRLVLLIDDLDRCVPTKIIGLLEAIKLFLDLRHTIILVAIDREIVQQGIQVFYRDFHIGEEAREPLTADYIDKMIQLPVYLHPLGSDQVGAYLRDLPMSPEFSGLHDLFRDCLLPNPRKIKRVLNIFALNSAIVNRDDQLRDSIDKDLLAKLILIQQQWHDLYQDCIRTPRLLRLLERAYREELDVHDPSQWTNLGPQQDDLRQLALRHFYPLSQLETMFTTGASFRGVNLDPYLFMLGPPAGITMPLGLDTATILYVAWKGKYGDDRIWNGISDGGPEQLRIRPVAQEWTSAGPAATTFIGKLYLAWRGLNSDTGIVFTGRHLSNRRETSTDTPNWEPPTSNTPPERIKDAETTAAPALAVFQDKLYLAWGAANNAQRLWLARSDDGETWTQEAVIPEQFTDEAPALTPFQGKLYLAWKGLGGDQRLWYAHSEDGRNWTNAQAVPHDARSDTGPAMCAFGNALYLAWKSLDDVVWCARYQEASEWQMLGPVTGDRTSAGPALVARGDTLYVFWKGENGDERIWYVTSPDGEVWPEPGKREIPKALTSAAPAVTVYTEA